VRSLAFAAILFLALPAAAADRSEQIRLKYVQVSEVEALFAPSREQVPDPLMRQAGIRPGTMTAPAGPPPLGRGVLVPGTQLVPDGITAWTTDPLKNVLTVAGTRESIDRLKAIIRLVDVEPARVRISVRLVHLTEAVLKEKGAEELAIDGVFGSTDRLFVQVLTPELAAQFAKAPTVSEVEMTTYNSRPLYVHWPRAAELEPSLAAVVARVNGDKTVSLMMPGRMHHLVGDQVASSHFMAMRRVAAGQSVLVQPYGTTLTAIVTIKEVLPKPGAKKRR
jgi:hypothetical protein